VSSLSMRVPFPPAVMLTLVLCVFLLAAVYMIAPVEARVPLLVCGALLVAVVAFTSVELTLYLLILSTLLSPELQFGGGEQTIETVGTTASRGITIRVDDLLLTVITLTWMFRMAVQKELGLVRRTPINQPIFYFLAISALSTVIGFGAGRVGLYGLFFVLKYLEYFVLFYMVINQIHTEDEIKRYIAVMLLTCFAASLIGIAQIPSGERVSAPFEGDIGEPNTFGGYLVLMFSVTLGIFLDEVDRNKRLLWLTLMGIIIVPLAFTQSRSSYLAFVVMGVLFILLSEKKRFVIGCALAGMVIMPFVLPKNVIDRVMFTFTQPPEPGQLNVAGVHIDTSTSERLEAWKLVLTKDFPKHPLLGVGVTGGRFLDAQYPRVLLESGLIGLTLFFWFLRRIWVLLRKCHREIGDARIRGASLGTLCGFGGLLFHAVGSNTFIIVRIMEPLMILLGLMLAALLLERERRGEAVQAEETA